MDLRRNLNGTWERGEDLCRFARQLNRATRALLLSAVCFLLFTSADSRLLAQTNEPPKAPPANRYLFVVETSRAMHPRADGGARAIGILLDSRMAGQFRLGDSVGLWTFDQTLHSGEFPLQHWSPRTHEAIIERAIAFVNSRKYENAAKPECVIPALNALLKESEYITVILVTTGLDPLHGLAVDESLNRSYKEQRRQQQNAQMPFITVLRATRGTLTDYSVTPAQWAVEMPPLPAELLAVVEPAKPPPPAPAPLTNLPPPFIVHGKKPESTPPVPAWMPDLPSARPVPSPDMPAISPSNLLAGVALRPSMDTTNTYTNAALALPALFVAKSSPKTVANLAPAADARLQQPAKAGTPAPAPAPPKASAPEPRAQPPAASPLTPVAGAAVSRSRWPLWLGGVCLLGVVSLVVLLRLRRPTRTHSSLITRSLERKPPL